MVNTLGAQTTAKPRAVAAAPWAYTVSAPMQGGSTGDRDRREYPGERIDLSVGDDLRWDRQDEGAAKRRLEGGARQEPPPRSSPMPGTSKPAPASVGAGDAQRQRCAERRARGERLQRRRVARAPGQRRDRRDGAAHLVRQLSGCKFASRGAPIRSSR